MLVKLIVLLLIVCCFGGGAMAYDLWPEGWSREERLGAFTQFAPEYDMGIDEKGDIWLGGFLGEGINRVRAVMYKKDTEIYSSSAFYNLDEPRVILGEDGYIYFFWLEKGRSQDKIFYTILTSTGDIVEESEVLYESEARITDLNIKPRGENLEIVWADMDRPQHHLMHMTFYQGDIIREPEILITADNRMASNAFAFDDEGNLNVFWRKVEDWDVFSFYQRYSPEREPLQEVKNMGRVTRLDGDRRPFVDVELKAFYYEGDIYFIFSQEDLDIGGEIGHLSVLTVRDGEIVEGPSRLTSTFPQIQSIDGSVDTEGIHLSWVTHLEGVFRPFYQQSTLEGEVVYGPQTMDITTSGGFSPGLQKVSEGDYYFFWQRYGDVARHIQVLTRNNLKADSPPLGYVLGLGVRNPFYGFVYVVIVGLGYAALYTLVTRFLPPIAVYSILSLGNRFKLLGNFERFPWHSALVICAGLFLFQETIIDFMAVQWPGKYFPLVCAILSTVFSLGMKKVDDRWLKLDNTMGWVFFMVLWVFWYSFFQAVPHLVMTS